MSEEECRLSSRELRREFLILIGTTYDQYGYPNYCGWIEGLLLLEPKEWTQRGISEQLNKLFPESKYPTSIPSVNRALKILETYGVVEKQGSRKTGYRYRIDTSANLVFSMLQQLIAVNRNSMSSLKALLDRNQRKDSGLRRAIYAELKAMRMWNHALEMVMESLGAEEKE
jgi:DNA-binding transcriptional regulator GbsR (MarR family)